MALLMNWSGWRPVKGLAGSAGRICAAVLILLIGLASTAKALTPESPEVKAAIEKGLANLQQTADSETRIGGKCLIGLCFWKCGKPIDHPLIQAGIQAAKDSPKHNHHEMYSVALALIFLCELEAAQPQLRPAAQECLTQLLKFQKPHGGWGYPGLPVGDTSQTQYAALGLWIAANHGFQVPEDAVERLAGWLVRTQDPSGTWAYQGQDPGSYQRIPQKDEKRLSLHVGGAGSMYIVADLLGIVQDKQPAGDRTLPPALRPVGQAENEKATSRKKGTLKAFDAQLARRSLADADQYFAQNYDIDPETQMHYYLYGLERYQSFKELSTGQVEREPRWYNEGAALLIRTQHAQGFWVATGDTHLIATCFSVLFLARSSHKTIAQIVPALGDGILLGSMGLPANVADITERDGKLVEAPLAGSIDELLALIEKPNADLDQLIDTRKPIVLDGDVTKRAGQITRLRALVRAGDFNARLIAVRTLAKTRDLDNAPLLIYALSDPIDYANPDYRIVLEADRGLRFLSRKFEGMGLPEQPSANDIQAAIRGWKEWYKSVRPDAEFLD